jgi:hypothetical protein
MHGFSSDYDKVSQASAHGKRRYHFDGALIPMRAPQPAGAVIAAFFRILYDRRFAFYGISFEYITGANVNAKIAPVANFLVKGNGVEHCSPPLLKFITLCS